MNCQKVGNLLSAFLDRELCYEDDRRIRRHLAFCQSCSTEYEELKAARDLVGSLSSQELPTGFWLELHERLKAEARHAGSGGVDLRIGPAGKKLSLLASRWWPSHFKTYKLVPAGVLIMVVLVMPFLVVSLEPVPESVSVDSFLSEHNLHAAEQALADEGPLTYRLTREELTALDPPQVGWQSASVILGSVHADSFADPSIHPASHSHSDGFQESPAAWRQP
ncbi:MAG: anti-sigma factor [Firmicutes bacterium]|nr:anti-sigma factor [Bacillota bacterium]